jgi:hypothetical protein
VAMTITLEIAVPSLEEILSIRQVGDQGVSQPVKRVTTTSGNDEHKPGLSARDCSQELPCNMIALSRIFVLIVL